RGAERCLASLPLEGGTITAETCPGLPATPADTFVDTWARPSLSPEGHEVAYKWQQGTIIGVLGFWSSSVVVAATDQPAKRTLTWPIVWIAPNGRLADDVATVTWADDHTLRFLIGYEFIFKVK